MKEHGNKVILHIDVNSAFLSWTAVYRLNNGETEDIREVPSVIGGDENNRHGIVLAKSTSAKAFGIVTGESLFSARRKCPEIKVFPASFNVYHQYSTKMMGIIKEYSPAVEQFSIDECFVDITSGIKDSAISIANEIKNRIYNELGFTVNIGISSNKLLAKMASELKKPNKVNTLYPYEIQSKMWPLPVNELFMVGRSAKEKLKSMYINTIGDLANYDVNILQSKFKSYGKMIWQYANGIDTSEIKCNSYSEIKAISNDITFAMDIISSAEAHKEIIKLCDNVSSRLRKAHKYCGSVSLTIRNSNFQNYSHQRKLKNPTDSTQAILNTTKSLFDETWRGEPIRLLSVQLSKLCNENYEQISLFSQNTEKSNSLDKTIDFLKDKYGDNSVTRSVFLKTKTNK